MAGGNGEIRRQGSWPFAFPPARDGVGRWGNAADEKVVVAALLTNQAEKDPAGVEDDGGFQIGISGDGFKAEPLPFLEMGAEL